MRESSTQRCSGAGQKQKYHKKREIREKEKKTTRGKKKTKDKSLDSPSVRLHVP